MLRFFTFFPFLRAFFQGRIKQQKGSVLFFYLLMAFATVGVMFALGYFLWMQVESWKE